METLLAGSSSSSSTTSLLSSSSSSIIWRVVTVLLFVLIALPTTTVNGFFSHQRYHQKQVKLPAPNKNKNNQLSTIERRHHSQQQQQQKMYASSWQPLDPESLVATKCLIEQTLCTPPPVITTNDESVQPQLAKDFEYANAILDAWKEEEQQSEEMWTAEMKSVQYQDVHGTPLFGRFVVREQPPPPADDDDQKRPGIVLFHTAAGPQDLFLLYKAVALVNQLQHTQQNDRNDDVVVLIADLFSDATGWAWQDDKTRYKYERTALFQNQGQLLEERVQAAFKALHRFGGGSEGAVATTTTINANTKPLAALGWCFGGFPIHKLATTMKNKNEMAFLKDLRAMVTYHGVFLDRSFFENNGDNVVHHNTEDVNNNSQPDPSTTTTDDDDNKCEVLICHGTDDPFVSDEMIETALETMMLSSTTSLLQLKGAKHGFTNPAQDFHPNQKAFGFQAEAAQKSWRQTLALLRRTLF